MRSLTAVRVAVAAAIAAPVAGAAQRADAHFITCGFSFPNGAPYEVTYNGAQYMVGDGYQNCCPLPPPELFSSWLYIQYRPNSGVPWDDLLPNDYDTSLGVPANGCAEKYMITSVLCKSGTNGYRAYQYFEVVHGNPIFDDQGGPVTGWTCS